MFERKGAPSALGKVTAVIVAAVMLLSAHARPAGATGIGDIISAAQKAYTIYQKLNNSELTLGQAKTQIVAAIQQAESNIIAHVDAIAAANVRACARSAVIDLPDIMAMPQDSLQAFATSSKDCVTLAESMLSATQDKFAIDQIGFALNTVGPIALVVRALAGYGTTALKDTLISANELVVVRLKPSCTATPLWGDTTGGTVEVQLRCLAFNGQAASDFTSVTAKKGQKLPAFDYSWAITQAMKGTSHELATAVLQVLKQKPVLIICCLYAE